MRRNHVWIVELGEYDLETKKVSWYPVTRWTNARWEARVEMKDQQRLHPYFAYRVVRYEAE